MQNVEKKYKILKVYRQSMSSVHACNKRCSLLFKTRYMLCIHNAGWQLIPYWNSSNKKREPLNVRRAIECEEFQRCYHLNSLAMSMQSCERYGENSKLVWICNLCLFLNLCTSFLMQNSLNATDENRFRVLNSPCASDPGSPLQASSLVTLTTPRKP